MTAFHRTRARRCAGAAGVAPALAAALLGASLPTVVSAHGTEGRYMEVANWKMPNIARTFGSNRAHLDGVITVDTDAMCAAVKDIFDDTRAVSEPSGALSLAGATAWAAENPGAGTLVAISSGANLNFDRLRHIAERAEIGEEREILIGVTIPERPGAYRAFIQALGARAITEFNYRYAKGADAQIFVGISTRSSP